MIGEGARLLAAALEIYLGVGFLFALAFAAGGVSRIDPSAAEATWGFRLLLVPGATLLWPYLLNRWLRHAPPADERTAHRMATGAQPAEPETQAQGER